MSDYNRGPLLWTSQSADEFPDRLIERLGGERHRPARSRRRRGRLGELALARRVLLALAHRVAGGGHRGGPAALGQRRPDGAVLLRRRARDQARARRRRAERPARRDAAGAGGDGGRACAGRAVRAIGFTVSLFIAGPAYDSPALQNQAKVGIFAASIVGGLLGAVILSRPAARR